MWRIFYDRDFRFFLKNSGAISVHDMMNYLYESNGTGYTKLSLTDTKDFIKNCPCIIVVDKSLWSDIIKRIEKKLNVLSFLLDVLRRIEERRNETVITRIYNKAYEDEQKRLTSVLEEMKKRLKAFEKNIEARHSFFNNSSIWIRLVIKDGKNDPQKIEIAKAELDYFKRIGLYDYSAAWENFEYFTRIQSQNYLESLENGHGNFVTPILYGDENAAREVLVKNTVSKHGNTDEDGKRKEQLDFKHMKHFHDIALRILLIDDKVGDKPEVYSSVDSTIEAQPESHTEDGQGRALATKNEASACREKEYISITKLHDSSNKTLKVLNCNGCKGCENNRTCKLHTIKRLMDDGANDDEKGKVLIGIGKSCEDDKLERDYFYWNEQDIDCYYCNTIIKDFIDDSKEQEALESFKEINVYSKSSNNSKDTDKGNEKESLNISCSFEPSGYPKDMGNKVQIVGVRDVRTALLLMSKYKFDMVFCDYLLDRKESERVDQRDYTNQLFRFLSHEFRNDDKLSVACKSLLDKLRQKVLDNRGPMGKLWIMPITGFNQTFIQDLYRNKTNLIDYRWSISNGADPITTPWQFLYHLNKLIELQLRMCVYKREQLLRFLLITCDDLKELEDRKKDLSFENEFKSIMGSDYATFMQLYGNQLPIKRDALTKYVQDTVDDKSVFATYIWNHFYQREEFIDVIEFNRLAHKFYHKASTMYNDSRGRRRLNEAFANLDLFIRTNKRITEIIRNEDNELSALIDDKERGLAYMKKLIAIITQDNNH